MFMTLLSYLGHNNHSSIDASDEFSVVSPIECISEDRMPMDDYAEEEWEQLRFPIPISEEEDYEIVIPSPDVLAQDTTESRGLLQRVREWRRQRKLQRDQLDTSIAKTFAELSKENASQLEEDTIQRAMELSMLDVALVHHCDLTANRPQTPSPHTILGVPKNATQAEIKNAYRSLARLHHPDKGGEAHRFEEIARAYRSLLSSTTSKPGDVSVADSGPLKLRLTTAMCDKELQDHRRLVNTLFQADGMDLQASLTKQLKALEILGLTFRDAGATNRNERNEIIHNSCFYLSLATSYLWGIGALSSRGDSIHSRSENEEDQLLVGDTALQLKRTIEAAVVRAHPEWVLQGKVGEEVQAFSDFLVYSLDSPTLLSEWAVVVFDATSGFCDIYKGLHYDSKQSALQSNTITLRYIPGHYQPIIPLFHRPSLSDILSTLNELEIFYAVTDGM